MRCFQAWLATVYKPNVHALNKPLSIPFRVKDPLLWWIVPSNLCSGVLFLQDAPSLIMTTDASLTGWDFHHSPGAMVFNWNLPAHKRPRTSSHRQCLLSLPPINPQQTFMDNDRQHLLHVLCKQAGRSSLSLALHRSYEALELVPCEQHPDISRLSSQSYEYHSGRIKQMLSLGSWMRDKWDNHPQHIPHLGLPNYRPFCNCEKH